MFKLSKKIAIPLIAVLIIGTGVGGYFLFRNFQIPKYFVDKYPELLDYCDTTQNGNNLKVSCKALMLDLKPNDGSPSLTSLVITNAEKLKEYAITEKESVFSFTNDILQFKKLKPVIINLQYNKGNLLKYSLNSITFEDIPETYIQEIVNRDIEEIMGMDKSSTTILNSFDFCPRPEVLPDYVTKKEKYTEYWGKNILTKAEYQDDNLYTATNREIKILFGCDSQINLGYLNKCPRGDVNLTNDLKKSLNTLDPEIPQWDTELDGIDLVDFKQISLSYDGINNFINDYWPFMIDGKDITTRSNHSEVLVSLINKINSKENVKEEVFCGTVKLLQRYREFPEIQKNLDKLTQILLENISESSSILCTDVLDTDLIDSSGLYLKNIFTYDLKEMNIFNRCINLQKHFK